MPASPRPDPDESPKAPVRPVSVRVAVAVLTIIAGLMVASAALTFVARDELVQRAVERGSASASEAERAILIGLLPVVVIALLVAVSAWGLNRRHAWARWTGLGASLMLLALTLLTMLAAGGLTLVSLLLLLLSMAAATSLLARTTAEWIPRLRD